MSHTSEKVPREQIEDNTFSLSRRKLLVFGLLSALGGMSPMQVKAFWGVVARLLFKALPRMARSGARASGARRLAVTSSAKASRARKLTATGGATGTYSRSSANVPKGSVRHSQHKRKVRSEVDKTPNTTVKDRIELVENFFDAAELLSHTNNSKAAEHVLREWEHQDTDFSHIEECKLCGEVYTSITKGTSLSGSYYKESHHVEDVVVYGKPIYRPKENVSGYVHCKLRGHSNKVCELVGDNRNIDLYKIKKYSLYRQ